MAAGARVVGIDVGGASKGYHVVGLAGGAPVPFRSSEPKAVVQWCREFGARAVGVDAPCRWSVGGGSRACERQLMARKIWCFSTPTAEVAAAHVKNFYGWMIAGRALFDAFPKEWRLFDGGAVDSPVVFETFPHAIVCALAGRAVHAKPKGEVRRTALRKEGVEAERLRNIDFVDAALCALTAQRHLDSKTFALGDRQTGFIVLPDAAFLRM